MRNVFYLLVLSIVIAIGCDGNDPGESAEVKYNKQLHIDTLLIDKYLSDRGIVALPDTLWSGLRYVIHESGTGKSPKFNTGGVPGDCFETDYLGKLLEGDVPFDTAFAFRTSLSGAVINGWKYGFRYLQEGDSATIYIPSGLAYGTSKRGTTIPANAILYFNIRLRKVVTPEFNPASGQYDCYYEDIIVD